MCGLPVLGSCMTGTPPTTPPTSPGGSSASSQALFTLLGAALTAAVSFVAVLVKHWLDSSSEKQKHVRELEKLRLEREARRNDALLEQQRKLFASFLLGTHAVYQALNRAREQRRRDQDDEAYRQALKSITPVECQVSLEEMRLIGSQEVVAHAESLWRHVRGHGIAREQFLGEGMGKWKDQYWELRSAFVHVCQSALGQNRDKRGAEA